jgi:group I intron endonuclease
MNAAGIYRIKVDRGSKPPMFYVGQAIKFRDRELHHRRTLRVGKHKNPRLQRAFNKYGEGAFSFEILLICERRKEILSLYEQAVLDAHGPSSVYNIRLQCVDSCLGLTTSPKTKAKQSAAHLGKKPSAETCARISEGRSGWTPSPEHVEHLRRLGRSETNRIRMSELSKVGCDARRGKKKPVEEMARRTATRRRNAEARGEVY